MAKKENSFWASPDSFFAKDADMQELNFEDLDGIAGGVVNYQCVKDAMKNMKDCNYTKEQAKERFKKLFNSYTWGPIMSSDGSEQDLEDILKYVDKKWNKI